MNALERIDSDSEKLLRLLSNKPASLSDLSFATGLSLEYWARHMNFLVIKKYIKNVAVAHTNDGLNLRDPYSVTLEGISYLENIDRIDAKDRRQRMINKINMTIALMALLKSFLPEFISLWKLLMQ